MEVTCPACQARYTANAEKLRGKTARMRCRACDTVWLVSGPPSDAQEPSTTPRRDGDGDSGRDRLDSDADITQRPHDRDDRASRRPEAVTRTTPPQPQAPTAVRMSAAPAPVIHDARPTTSKHAAVVRRGAERERRDLFATRPPDLGSVKQTVAPRSANATPRAHAHADGPPASDANGPQTIGARNENSLLFRLDQLVAPKAASPRQEAPVTLAHDDEGIIDLMALSTRSPGQPATRPLAASPVGPLFSEPPPAAFARDASNSEVPSRPMNRAMLIGGIGAGALAVVLAIFGLSLTFKGADPVAHRMVNATILRPHPASPPAATPAPTPAADPAATTSASADEDPKGKKGKGRGAKGWKKMPPASGVAVASKPAAPRPMPKAADPCHCRGDFNCIIACSAKGHR